MPRWNVCPISIAVETCRLAGERQEGQVEDSEGLVRAVLWWVTVGPVGFDRGRWARRPSRTWVSVRVRVGFLVLRADQVLKGASRVVSRVGWSFLRRWVFRGPLSLGVIMLKRAVLSLLRKGVDVRMELISCPLREEPGCESSCEPRAPEYSSSLVE